MTSRVLTQVRAARKKISTLLISLAILTSDCIIDAIFAGIKRNQSRAHLVTYSKCVVVEPNSQFANIESRVEWVKVIKISDEINLS